MIELFSKSISRYCPFKRDRLNATQGFISPSLVTFEALHAKTILFLAVTVFSIFLIGVILCCFFARAGLGKGETVTLMLPNRADFYVPVLAAWRCGAAVSLVDPLQQPGQKLQSAEISAGSGEKKRDKTVAEFCANFLKSAKKFVLSIS